jgi:hypothetical protein
MNLQTVLIGDDVGVFKDDNFSTVNLNKFKILLSPA